MAFTAFRVSQLGIANTLAADVADRLAYLPAEQYTDQQLLFDDLMRLRSAGTEYLLLFMSPSPDAEQRDSVAIASTLCAALPVAEPKAKICAGITLQHPLPVEAIQALAQTVLMSGMKLIVIGGQGASAQGLCSAVAEYSGSPVANYLMLMTPADEIGAALSTQFVDGDLARLAILGCSPALEQIAISDSERVKIISLAPLLAHGDGEWIKLVKEGADFLAAAHLPSVLTVVDTAAAQTDADHGMTYTQAKVFVGRSCNRLKSRHLHLALAHSWTEPPCKERIAGLILAFYASHQARGSINLQYQPL